MPKGRHHIYRIRLSVAFFMFSFVLSEKNCETTLKWTKKITGYTIWLSFLRLPRPFIIFELLYNPVNDRKLKVMQKSFLFIEKEIVYCGMQLVFALWIATNFTSFASTCKFFAVLFFIFFYFEILIDWKSIPISQCQTGSSQECSLFAVFLMFIYLSVPGIYLLTSHNIYGFPF